MKSFNRPRNDHRLCFEQLEGRQLLAVTVTGDDTSNLVITSDAAGDRIQVLFVADNEVQVFVGDPGEEVLVLPEGGGTSFSTFGDITINLNDGDDDLNVDGDFDNLGIRTLSGDLTIISGGGNDIAGVQSLNVGGDLSINNSGSLGTEFEQIGVTDVNLGGALTIEVGASTDSVNVASASIIGSFLLATGAGNDFVNIADVKAADDVFAMLGSGDDSIFWQTTQDDPAPTVGGSLSILTGSGIDTVQLFGTGGNADMQIGGGFNLIMGAQPDSATLFRLNVEGTTLITGAADTQSISIIDSIFDDVVIATGAGDDIVDISGSTSDILLLIGGSGTDTLSYSASEETFVFENFEVGNAA